MANMDKVTRLRCAVGNATTGEVNAGHVIVPAAAGRTLCVVGGWLRALGGAAGTCTSVDIKDTNSSAVVAIAFAQASLTQDTVLKMGDAGTTLTTVGTALTANEGLQIETTGTAMDTATSVDYAIEYVVS